MKEVFVKRKEPFKKPIFVFLIIKVTAGYHVNSGTVTMAPAINLSSGGRGNANKLVYLVL